MPNVLHTKTPSALIPLLAALPPNSLTPLNRPLQLPSFLYLVIQTRSKHDTRPAYKLHALFPDGMPCPPAPCTEAGISSYPHWHVELELDRRGRRGQDVNGRGAAGDADREKNEDVRHIIAEVYKVVLKVPYLSSVQYDVRGLFQDGEDAGDCLRKAVDGFLEWAEKTGWEGGGWERSEGAGWVVQEVRVRGRGREAEGFWWEVLQVPWDEMRVLWSDPGAAAGRGFGGETRSDGKEGFNNGS